MQQHFTFLGHVVITPRILTLVGGLLAGGLIAPPLYAQSPAKITCSVHGRPVSATDLAATTGIVVSLRDTIVFTVSGLPTYLYQINGLHIEPTPCPLAARSAATNHKATPAFPFWPNALPSTANLKAQNYVTSGFAATTVLRIPVTHVLNRNIASTTITLPVIIRNPEQLDITAQVKRNSPLSYTFTLANACTSAPLAAEPVPARAPLPTPASASKIKKQPRTAAKQ